jgi:hypothetical protein
MLRFRKIELRIHFSSKKPAISWIVALLKNVLSPLEGQNLSLAA